MSMKEPGYLPYSDEINSENESDLLLDQILKTDAMTPLPEDFADRIAMKAVRRITLKQSLTEFFVYAAVIITAGLIFSGIFYFANSEDWIRWEKFFSSNLNLLPGISLILFFIFFADLVLFPWLFFRKQNKVSDQVPEG